METNYNLLALKSFVDSSTFWGFIKMFPDESSPICIILLGRCFNVKLESNSLIFDSSAYAFYNIQVFGHNNW